MNGPDRPLRVLALAPFPIEAAGTRFRLMQLTDGLRDHGVEVTLHPFLHTPAFSSFYVRSAWKRNIAALIGASARRLVDVWDAREADVLLILREAAVFGPPLFEWLAMHLGSCPMVLDLDDATYVSYVSPTYGRAATWLKWPGKTDQLIRWARLATCGNPAIAEHVSAQGTETRVLPTVVDTELFRPRDASLGEDGAGGPTVGWIGTHSTFPFLESLVPVLEELASDHRFRLKVVGSGRDTFTVRGVDVENLPWRLEREPSDFRSLDIGLYPLLEDRWSVGKSGLKSIQYMAVGVPFVASPVGVVAELGEPGVTHLIAGDHQQWSAHLSRLLRDAALRRSMGDAGRRHALARYTVRHGAEALAGALHEAASGPSQHRPQPSNAMGRGSSRRR